MRLPQSQIDILQFVYNVYHRDDAPQLFAVRVNDRVYLKVGNTDEALRFPLGAYTALLGSDYIRETPPIRKGNGTQVAILPLGIRVVEGGFEHVDTNPASKQTINITGGTIGNFVTAVEGNATVTGSPVQQGSPDIGELLQRLADSIGEAELPPDVKDDAKLEASQVALELQKNRKDLPEIERHLSKLGKLSAGATTVVANLDKLRDAIGALASG